MKSRISLRVLQNLLLTTCLIGSANVFSAAPEAQPIAYVGHGAFFDGKGKQIDLTQEFVTKAQAFYRSQLLADLAAAKQAEFVSFEKQLLSSKAEGQTRLALQQRALEWLFINSSQLKNDSRLQSKLRALSYALTWEMPAKSGAKPATIGNPFKLDAATSKQVGALGFNLPGATTLATTNGGTAYINECIAAQVPIPPTIGVMDPAGLTGWKSQGFIPVGDQFIINSPAELRTYSTPQGMCMALPRYNNSLSTVAFDGVICMSKITSKVCFWDNQMSGSTFSYPSGAQIPIGVANLGIDPAGRFQSGGAHLTSGGAGMCTDCHAGENPYIIHPNSNLGGGNLFGDLGFAPQNLPTFAPNRYVPLVLGSWPQNDLSQAASTVPSACGGCHVKGAAGRFPHLSNQIPGYCGTILQGAINNTMPPFNPGGLASDPSVMSFVSTWCNAPPNSSSADAGDPHITTTNGIHYDFQAAGEFTALKNADTGFELQTRQSPVITTFIPGTNPWTGLQSCVSLNTAAALRAGKSRITYQLVNSERPQVRVDGKVIDQTKGVNFGDGNIINASTNGGPLDFIAADGTHVTINPLYWSSQGYWYLDVKVQNTPAREGVMGHIQSGDWLPRDPSGSSFGARPVALIDRYTVLNQKFADAWRVTSSSSLFDYATGTSTASFTDRNWPSAPGKACTSTSIVTGKVPVVKQAQPELAKTACAKIRNPDILADCLLDVTVFGDAAAANVHLAADQQKTGLSAAK